MLSELPTWHLLSSPAKLLSLLLKSIFLADHLQMGELSYLTYLAGGELSFALKHTFSYCEKINVQLVERGEVMGCICCFNLST
jgi:hypothetical protein